MSTEIKIDAVMVVICESIQTTNIVSLMLNVLKRSRNVNATQTLNQPRMECVVSFTIKNVLQSQDAVIVLFAQGIL